MQVSGSSSQVPTPSHMQQEGLQLRLLHQLSPHLSPPPPGVSCAEAAHSPSLRDLFCQVQEEPEATVRHDDGSEVLVIVCVLL
ncbi:hypothetical protein E2C01_042403 [Portunus trituberculatus]|uniref:Uncharacterized protein n=1 Tax=Portunus trituberculatus TaxID=210409 RepID=A0A5B7FUK3_PORTR|nr:hypothetical protein [Portunus trituberculatus]